MRVEAVRDDIRKPKFKELGKQLEKIREKHEQGLHNSLKFLEGHSRIAKNTVEVESQVDHEEEKDKVLSALTELFGEVKSKHTHVIVERIVADFDIIVKQVAWIAGRQRRKANERSGERAESIGVSSLN